MWNRRCFLEMVSGLPLVGRALGATTLPAVTTLAAKRDYFRDLGVRPFINAPGTHIALTSSVTPPEVMAAIQHASEHYMILDELHDRIACW